MKNLLQIAITFTAIGVAVRVAIRKHVFHHLTSIINRTIANKEITSLLNNE